MRQSKKLYINSYSVTKQLKKIKIYFFQQKFTDQEQIKIAQDA
jgi:hypothetical protein